MTTSATSPAGQPYRLLTVNNAPTRAKLLIGRVTANLANRYAIEHVGNCLCEFSSYRSAELVNIKN